ncbi:hypothetical protein DFH06DRAFT_1466963 [Mycena polygramma]|nr:hypothetical protein DFH06DRAFT_1466963 [Mycena polygramma]
MKVPSLSLILLFSLSGDAAGLSVHSGLPFSPPEVAPSKDPMSQEGLGTVSKTMLWKRAARLNRETTTTIIVGVIGGIAMIGALFLGILLVVRKRLDRKKLRALTSGKNAGPLPSKNNPPLVPETAPPESKERPYAYQNVPPLSPAQPKQRGLDTAESAWFLDDGDSERGQPGSPRPPPVGYTLSNETSQQSSGVPQNSGDASSPVKNSPGGAPSRVPSRKTSRQELNSAEGPSTSAEISTARTPSKKTSRPNIASQQNTSSTPLETSPTRVPSRQTTRQELNSGQGPSTSIETSTARTPSRQTSRPNVASPQIPSSFSNRVENSSTRTPSRKTSRQELNPDQGPTTSVSPTRAPSRKTSRQNVALQQDRSMPVESSVARFAAATPPLSSSSPSLPSSYEPESALISRVSKSTPQDLHRPLPHPPREPERPPSPILFRQPRQPDSITLVPRPRGSSLRGDRPAGILPSPPAAGRHVISVSEDIRPVSRFSISPVARSFPSRITGSPPSSSQGRHSRRRGGFGSLSSLVHLRSDVTPDVPSDIAASSQSRRSPHL